MQDADKYWSVGGKAEGLYKDKGSRFISYVYPISSPEEVKPLVDALKKEHHAARHCCYAWRVGKTVTLEAVSGTTAKAGMATPGTTAKAGTVTPGTTAKAGTTATPVNAANPQYRVNDDGEPSGSAGRPILAAMDSEGVSDALVVVVRYFGGILLGVPGLVQAYRSAAADALAKAGKKQKMLTGLFEISFAYEQMQTVMNFVRSFEGVEQKGQNFDLECSMTVAVPLSETKNFKDKIKHINDEKGTHIQCRPL